MFKKINTDRNTYVKRIMKGVACFVLTGLLAGCGRNQAATLPESEAVNVQEITDAAASATANASASADAIQTVSADTTLTVTALKAGAADAFVLMTDNHVTLIDTGLDSKADKLVDFLYEQGVTRIDEMIITHFDKDHVGGADHILSEFEVGTIYTTYQSKESDDITAYMEALTAAGLSETEVTELTTYEADGVTYAIYPPKAQSYAEKTSNNSSLVIKVSVGDNSMLFAGDAEAERIEELLDTQGLQSTILKVPHHGRYNANSQALIDYVSPKYAIITSSKSEPEDQEVLDALSAAGVKTYLTRDGNITIRISGSEVEISQ